MSEDIFSYLIKLIPKYQISCHYKLVFTWCLLNSKQNYFILIKISKDVNMTFDNLKCLIFNTFDVIDIRINAFSCKLPLLNKPTNRTTFQGYFKLLHSNHVMNKIINMHIQYENVNNTTFLQTYFCINYIRQFSYKLVLEIVRTRA